jgi:hypothetical protein
VVSLLTDDTRQVLGLVNLSLAAGLVANLVYLTQDAPVVNSLGDLVTTGIGLAVLVRIWQVFPFDFAGWSVDWSWLVGSLIAIAVQVASPLRRAITGGARPRTSP